MMTPNASKPVEFYGGYQVYSDSGVELEELKKLGDAVQ